MRKGEWEDQISLTGPRNIQCQKDCGTKFPQSPEEKGAPIILLNQPDLRV